MARDSLRSRARTSTTWLARWRARSGAVALLLAATMLPSVATADDKESARTHFNRGVQLYHSKNLDGALAEFRRAYELAPSYRVLFNIGQLQYDLHEWAAAQRALEQYLAEGGDAVPADRKAQVMSLLEKCREFTAHVDLTVETPGVVTLDEVPVGKSPLRSDLIMDPGKHRLTLAPEGGGPLVVRSIEVASGDRVAVELAPAPEPTVTPIVTPVPVTPPVITLPPETAKTPPPSRTPAWISLGVTTALVGGTVASALITNNAQNALERQLDNVPLDDGHVRGRRKDVKTAAVVTDILGATAIASGVLTTYFFLRGPSRSSTTASARSFDVSVGPTSAGVSGTF